ncbi:RNA 2'-phosphotransferase [Nostoc sp. WHI]|uniref:RNA 2'-phosphotransferase n=1 Tax=Nostoc sp. WHI TaxID=2650611 RepID=UPI0018C70773|nr:RNA 2'-phosphotransferase [Nostoc sp. WHI]MBG1265114.1 RNA 2'-phosphotransferase [Nostoc sp. WHI]
MSKHLESTSKFLSLVLRHQPEAIGLTLDDAGWANVAELIKLSNNHNRALTLALLQEVVANNDKKRFAFSSDGSKIRASQGHSVAVELELPVTKPPEVLYHGTATRFVESIKQQGLLPGSRQHVHLSADHATAVKVGQRHGKPFVLEVAAKQMQEAGHKFYHSENAVWLVVAVPVQFITFS